MYKVYTLEEAMELTNRLPKGNKPFVVLDEDNLCLSTYDTLSDANQDVCKYNIQEEAVADLVSLLRNARTTISKNSCYILHELPCYIFGM